MDAEHVLFLGQTLEGVVFGSFANSSLSGDVQRSGPALRSAIFVVEHPTGGQRNWQPQDANYAITVCKKDLWVGTGFCVDASGFVLAGRAPEFGMGEVDASFITLRPAMNGGGQRRRSIAGSSGVSEVSIVRCLRTGDLYEIVCM
jgi:hypothetical protein